VEAPDLDELMQVRPHWVAVPRQLRARRLNVPWEGSEHTSTKLQSSASVLQQSPRPRLASQPVLTQCAAPPASCRYAALVHLALVHLALVQLKAAYLHQLRSVATGTHAAASGTSLSSITHSISQAVLAVIRQISEGGFYRIRQ
jgi:hypothetical protein